MAERIVLDPTEETVSRTEFDVTSWISEDGVDWGEAAIDASMADQTIGASPVDYRIPNRVVTIPLTFVTRGGTVGPIAQTFVQQKAGLFQREGGVVKRITNGGGIVYADVVNASVSLSSVAGFESRADIDIDASLVLECRPDFYGSEITLGEHAESTLPEVIFTESSIDGNYPAGNRCRIVVDQGSGNNQRGLFGGIRSRHYSSDSTAALAYQAEALDPLDAAATATISGASGNSVVRHTSLSTNWTPVLGTNVSGATYLTHTGSYRVRARVYSTSGGVRSKFIWDIGDLVNPIENPEVRLPGASTFFILDYGEIRLDRMPVGTHRWQGAILAAGDGGGENFSVDRIWFQPTGESAWQLKAPVMPPVPTTYSARSEFNTESSGITGDSLAVGGTWTGAGDASDFTVTPGGGTAGPGFALRSAVSDADLNTGRYITASTPTLTATVVQVGFTGSAVRGRAGVLARYSSISNWAYFGTDSSVADGGFALIKRVSGTVTTIASGGTPTSPVGASAIRPGVPYTFRLVIYSDGLYSTAIAQSGGKFQPVFAGYDAQFATGGALASGKVGIYDAQTVATATGRVFTGFAAWAPEGDAVVFASQTAELASDGMRRVDAAGTSYGPVAWTEGDLPRLPVAGLEARATQVLVKTSRGDLDDLADLGIDDTSVQIAYRPCWLQVPET